MSYNCNTLYFFEISIKDLRKYMRNLEILTYGMATKMSCRISRKYYMFFRACENPLLKLDCCKFLEIGTQMANLIFATAISMYISNLGGK